MDIFRDIWYYFFIFNLNLEKNECLKIKIRFTDGEKKLEMSRLLDTRAL